RAGADERRGLEAPEGLRGRAPQQEPGGRGEPAQLDQRVRDRDARVRQVGAYQDGALGLGRSGMCLLGQRNDSMPAPSTRSTASSTSALAATRMLSGSARMVSLVPGRKRCRKAWHG